VFIIAVFGGLGSIPGAIAGTIVIKGIGYFKDIFPDAVADSLQFLVSGIGIIIVLAALPGGLGQVMYGVRDRWLKSVADRKGIHVPSLVADRRIDGAPEAPTEAEPPTRPTAQIEIVNPGGGDHAEGEHAETDATRGNGGRRRRREPLRAGRPS